MTYLKLYVIATVVFFAIDLVWIGVVAQGFYQKHLGHLLAPSVRWPAAIAFYAIYIAGLVVLALAPGIEADSLARTAFLGACAGFFAYATFDLTCMALFRGFPWIVVAVDLVWGTVLSTTVCVTSHWIARFLGWT